MSSSSLPSSENDIVNEKDIKDIIDDDENGTPLWIISDVKNYAKQQYRNDKTIRHHQARRPSTDQISDDDMKSRMTLYRNYNITKTDVDKKIDPNDRIRDKLVEVLATVDNDDPNKDNLVNKLLAQVENNKRKRRETRLKQFDVAFGKSMTPRSPIEQRKSNANDTFNRGSMTRTSINSHTHASSSVASETFTRGSMTRSSISSHARAGSTLRTSMTKRGLSVSGGGNGYDMQQVLAIAPSIQNDEETKKLALKQEKMVAHQKLLACIACCKALKLLRAAKILSTSRRKTSMLKISSAVSKYRAVLNGKRVWSVLSRSSRVWVKIRLIRKACALKLVSKFVNDFSLVFGARVIKRFKFYRYTVFKQLTNFTLVTRARCELIGLYWDKVEKAYRKQCHDNARAIESQKRKELTDYLKTLDKNSTEGKWNMISTHKDQFMYQLDNVQGQYQRAGEGYFKEPGFDKWIEIKSSIIKKAIPGNKNNDTKKKENTKLVDLVDLDERYKIIREELRKKREILKVRRSQEEDKRAQILKKRNDFAVVDANMAKSLLSCEGKTIYDQAVLMAELVEKQLEPCKNIHKAVEHQGRKNYTMNVLTDSTLGESWKQIIENYVALDMKNKKEKMQQTAQTVETKSKPGHILLQPGGGRYITTASGRRFKIAGVKWKKTK